MVCRTTSIKGRRRHGFTLVEMLMATAIGSLILAAVAALSFYTGRSFASLANYVDLDNYSRNALDVMAKEIRQVNKLSESTETSLTFQDSDGKRLSYIYDPSARTLTRRKEGQPDDILLRECDYLKFSIYQRNPVAGTYDQYEVATPGTCKLVQLRWICSRQIFGAKINTESVQSAKIVIRKQ